MTDATLFTPPKAPTRTYFDYNKLVEGFFWLTIGLGSIVVVEPSPYDFLILITIALWAMRGFSVHRALLPFFLLEALWLTGGFVSLIPYWNEPDPVGYMFHTLFLVSTVFFFALFLSQRTTRRVDLLLHGYTVSCVVAATIAVLAWFGVFGDDAIWVKGDRAMGPFKDPNVLGSYLVIAIVYLAQRLLLGRRRYLWLVLPSLAIILTALFLTFSRGSWGAAIVAVLMLSGFLLKTADSRRLRFRIATGATGLFLAAAIGLMAALTVDSVRDYFFERAHAEQSYDEGPNGRFGNQQRSIPMLLERPNGFGPLRFRLTFGLEPHNSYINAFASMGWLGGFSFIMMSLSTWFVGFRLSLTRHPWRRQAQVLFAATFVIFLQAFQIDIDHWRMFYLGLGAIWGMEAARRRWLASKDLPGPVADPI